jgi:hypothetical protein
MKLKSALLAVLAGSAAIAAPAFADNGWHHGRHHAPARVIVRPAPVVVAPSVAPSYYYSTPAPVFYSPAPVYYRPAPVYYQPAPVYRPAPVVTPGVSIRFHLPL